MEIAVIVPYRNQISKLTRCLDSIRHQSTGDSVIIVVDDGSEPPLVRSDDYHLIRFPRNMGVQQARNAGYMYAKNLKSDFILFCDQDVYWKPRAFYQFLQALRIAPECAYAYGDYERYGQFNGVFRAGPFSSVRLQAVNFVSTMALVRSECLPKVPFVEDEKRLQDWSLWLRMLNAGHKGVYTDEVMFETGFSKESVSSRGPADYQYWHQLMQRRYVKR